MNTDNALAIFNQIYAFLGQAIQWVLYNPEGQDIKALIILVSFLTLSNVIKNFVKFNIEVWVLRKHPNVQMELLKELEAPLKFIPLILGVYFSIMSYTPASIFYLNLQENIFETIWLFTSFWLLYTLVNPFAMILNNYSNKFSTPAVVWVIKLFRIILVFSGTALILEIWGVQIGPILAGLGLFGMAVALGAKDLFKNILAGITIIAEKRLIVGDHVQLIHSEIEGCIYKIGFRSTIIKRFDQAPLHIPNSELADFALINYTERKHRRIRWDISLEYRTSTNQLKLIQTEIITYLLKNPDICKPSVCPLRVRYTGFGSTNLNLIIYCFTTTNEWEKYLQIQEEVFFKLKEIVEESGAAFAFPSQSIYVEQNLTAHSKRGKVSDKDLKTAKAEEDKIRKKLMKI